MDGEGWSDGHLALFDALSVICKTIGEESAAEVAKHVAQSDGRDYITELNRLRRRAEKADQLQVENARLRSELDETLSKLALSRSTSEQHAKPCNIHNGLNDVQSDETYKNKFEKLVERHNPLVVSHTLLKEAKDMLEVTLKKRAKERDDWMAYADGLSKKIKKQEKVMKEYNLLKSGSCIENELPPVPATIQEMEHINKSIREVSSTRPRCSGAPPFNVPATLSPSPSEVEGETLIGTPEAHLVGRIEGAKEFSFQAGHSEEQLKPPNKSENNPIAYELPRISPKTRQRFTDGLISSPVHHSSSTQGEIDEATDLAAPIESPAPAIKVESALDSPVFLFTRSVKKSSRSRTTPRSPAVKVEHSVSSPPLSVAHINSVDPHLHESIDLDEIGEKIDTPKKRRQVLVEVQIPIGAAVALQPGSPNNQILLQNSPRFHPVKRKRVDEHVELFAEDGENYGDEGHTTKIKTLPIKPNIKAQLDPSEVRTRLSGLLEYQSPQRQVLSHPKNQKQPVFKCSPIERALENGSPQQNLKPASANTRRFTKSGRERFSTPRPVTGAGQIRHTPCQNTSSSRNQDIARMEADDPSHEPFRARPTRRLGLEHFKVNQQFSGGYNYAFQEVVRGREQRKCLPGCTNPECCGEIFRKIVESTMADEPTRSQEEKDERLLEEFLGRNKCRLDTMNEEERKDVLVEAKVRELANKSAKHRQFFERRRSPPGFWRSDFPSTQETEADRAEARQVERRMVQERYDEAMRHGGRWKFADE